METQIYRTCELARRLGVARSTVWRWVRDGLLPKPIHIGPQVRGWRAREIDEWLNTRGGVK